MTDKPDIKEVRFAVPEADNLEEIDSGGFKVVYRANIDGKTEAVKLVQIPSDENDETIRDENLRRIRREINILKKCNTPYLVKLGSISPKECRIGTKEYVLYSEEYIPGNSLRKLIIDRYRPRLQELVCLLRCVLYAIIELSSLNIVHRDIKPDNTIKTEIIDRPYILLDLGIAFQIGGTQITHNTVRIPGTLYYIAPEMLDPGFRQSLDYRADIYTAALTVYEFASGLNPFARGADPQFTTLYRIKTETPRPLETLRDDLPNNFSRMVDQMVRKLPALRPSNLKLLLKQTEEYL